MNKNMIEIDDGDDDNACEMIRKEMMVRCDEMTN